MAVIGPKPKELEASIKNLTEKGINKLLEAKKQINDEMNKLSDYNRKISEKLTEIGYEGSNKEKGD